MLSGQTILFREKKLSNALHILNELASNNTDFLSYFTTKALEIKKFGK